MKIHFADSHDKQLRLLDELKEVKKLALDTETTGLDARIATCRLVQMCSAEEVEPENVYIFDLWNIGDKDPLRRFIESREILIAHNWNFDYQFLLSEGIEFRGKLFCTYLAERTLRAGFKEQRIAPQTKKTFFADVSCSLKAVAERRLGIELDKQFQKSDWGASALDQGQLEYGAMDVLILPKIARSQIQEMTEENLMGIYSIESKCIRPVALMCHRGFATDVGKLTQLKTSVEQELAAKTLEFVTELDRRLPEDSKLPRGADGSIAVGKNAKKEFNPGSTTQVIKAFTLCGIEVPKDSVTNKLTLNQIALSEFDSSDPTLNLYRERVKIETKLEHCEKLLTNVNPVTRRIHSQYNSFGANSGRFTCNGAPRESKKAKKSVFAVNIQQVPRAKEYRECFVAERGFQLVIADYNQMELRLLAELADIPQMQEAYNNNIDLHQLTASLMNSCPIEQVTKHQRQMAKGANFGMIFGIGFRKFKTYAASSFGLQLSLSDSKILHSKFHAAYPKLREWHRQRGALVEDGWCYIRTAMGRRRLLSYDDAKMTTAANTLIQGTGADILKTAMAELNEYLDESVRLVAAVHDEIVLEVRNDLVDTWRVKLPEIMVRAGDSVFRKTKLVAEPGVGNDWSAK